MRMDKRLSELVARLNDIGFEKTRRAVAALSLSFFVTLYVIIALGAPEGWAAALLALGACYVVAFVGLVADWFWGRWFASGLGWSGVMVAILSTVMLGYSPPLIIYGALHGLVVLALLGKRMAALYDMQEAWRQRFGMDEYGVARLRKTVTRAAASLPSVILWALAPKEPGQALVQALLAVALGGLAVAGLGGVVRNRSWGVVALASAAVGMVAQVLGGGAVEMSFRLTQGFALRSAFLLGPQVFLEAGIFATVAAVILIAAVAPFAGPIRRYLRSA
jgi:hypothetical protein